MYISSIILFSLFTLAIARAADQQVSGAEVTGTKCLDSTMYEIHLFSLSPQVRILSGF